MKPMAYAVFHPTGESDYWVFPDKSEAQRDADTITQDSLDPNFQAEVIPLFAITTHQIICLRSYAIANGAVHDDGCPGDDTCECSMKPINEALQELCDIECD